MDTSEVITIKVVLLSGEVVWGPGAVKLSTMSRDLTEMVAKKLGVPSLAIHLVDVVDGLDSKVTLPSSGLSHGSTIQCVIHASIAAVYTFFMRFQKFIADNQVHTDFPNSMTVADAKDFHSQTLLTPLTRSDVKNALLNISSSAGLDALPDDVHAWLHVLLSAGKDFTVDEEFEFRVAHFLRGYGCGGLSACKKGLISLSTVTLDCGYRLCFVYYIIDAAGDLAKMYGEAGVGAVYKAFFHEVHGEPVVVENDAPQLSLSFWRCILHDHPDDADCMRVADNISDLFAGWMSNEFGTEQNAFQDVQLPQHVKNHSLLMLPTHIRRLFRWVRHHAQVNIYAILALILLWLRFRRRR